MINRWSDTPAKIIAWDLAGFVVAAFAVWWVDREEGITRNAMVLWAVLAVLCVGSILLHIRRLNRVLDRPPREEPATPPMS